MQCLAAPVDRGPGDGAANSHGEMDIGLLSSSFGEAKIDVGIREGTRIAMPRLRNTIRRPLEALQSSEESQRRPREYNRSPRSMLRDPVAWD